MHKSGQNHLGRHQPIAAPPPAARLATWPRFGAPAANAAGTGGGSAAAKQGLSVFGPKRCCQDDDASSSSPADEGTTSPPPPCTDGEDARHDASDTNSHQPPPPPISAQRQTRLLLTRALAELDRERLLRAESETAASALSSTVRRLRSDALALRAQRDAFVAMVESLTAVDSCDAVAHAAKRQSGVGAAGKNGDESASATAALSLHDIRLLEIMPWDERVRNVAEVVEVVYEWQVGAPCDGSNSGDNNGATEAGGGQQTRTWTSRVDGFPAEFRSLPVHRPGAGSSGSSGARNGETSSCFRKGVVLPDASCTRLLDLTGGYPLPTDDAGGSTWRWVGGWDVERHHPCGTPCDEDGWTYIDDNRHRHANPPTPQYRRRKWARLRVVISYPSVSARTEACLALWAENAIASRHAAHMEEHAGRMASVARRREEENRCLRRRLREAEAARRALEQERADAAIDGGSCDAIEKDGAATACASTPPSPPTSPDPQSGRRSARRRWSLPFCSASSPSKPLFQEDSDTTTNKSVPAHAYHALPVVPSLEDDVCASSPSQDTTYLTDSSSSEDDEAENSGTTSSQAGISMHPLAAARSAAQRACPEPVSDVIHGARRSLDEYGGTFFGRILRPKGVPGELRGGLEEIQIGEEDEDEEDGVLLLQ